MTWYQKLRGQPVVSSIFRQVAGNATQNDNMLRLLERLSEDRAAINDLFLRQGVSRDLIIHVLKARIIRRLT